MSIVRAVATFTGITLIALVVFYYFSDKLPVRIAGGLMILYFIFVLFRSAQLTALNKRAFHVSNDSAALPMAQQRKLLGTVRLHAESAEDRLFGTLASYTVLIALLGLTVHPWWLCVAALLATFPAYHATRRSWPGYALVLGASNQGSTRQLALQTTRIVAPLSTTNLLNMVTHSEVDHEVFQATSYRLKNEFVSWKAAVEIHAAFARVIIFDMTELTQGVREELQLLDEFWYKTIFYCPNDASRDALAPLLATHPAASAVSESSQLRASLSSLLQSFPQAPTPERSIGALIALRAK